MLATSAPSRILPAGILAPQLQAIAAELHAAGERLHRLVESLDPHDWLCRPEPERWSIGEQIVHLDLVSRVFVPIVEQAVRQGRREGITGPGPFRRDFLGWLLCRLAEPPVRLRARTAQLFEPGRVDSPEAVLGDFDLSQEDLILALYDAHGLALDRIEVTSPVEARLRYNLYSCLRALAAHQRRHLWLAERTRMELAGAFALEVAL